MAPVFEPARRAPWTLDRIAHRWLARQNPDSFPLWHRARRHPLQVRKLLYHFGDQVAFAEMSCCFESGIQMLSPQCIRDQRKQREYALGLVVVRSQFLLEKDMLEGLFPFTKRRFSIRIPKERRIGESGTQNSFVTGANDVIAIGLKIYYGKEDRQQLARFIEHREILLVLSHYGDKDFFWQ